MMYALKDLLSKMGAPEVREKQRIEWHYFDPETRTLAGYADVRLEAGGERLVAELRHLRSDYEDDNGKLHDSYTESFHLVAERSTRPDHYHVTKMTLDGDVYDKPVKAIVELGLSVFHAKALDISIRMVEQAFNKQDILDTADEAPVAAKQKTQRTGLRRDTTRAAAARAGMSPETPADVRADTPRREGYGIVVPFRPRTAVAAARGL